MLQSSTSRVKPTTERTYVTLFRGDYGRLSLLLLALLVLTGLPHLYALLKESGQQVYMGIVSDVPDTTQYFAWLRAHQESLIVSNWMTPEPNEPAFFNLLWLVLGHLALWTGLSFTGVFQVMRICAGLSFGFTLFWLYGLLAESRRERWLATLLVLLGGGVGWIWVIEKYVSGRSDLLFPLDAQVAEPNTFLSLIGYPHFLIAAALMFAIFGLFVVAERLHQMRWFVLAAVVALLLSVQHAYDLLTIYLVLGAYVLLRWWNSGKLPWHSAIGLTIIGLVSSPPAAYFTYLTSTDPMWRQVLAQFSNAGIFTPNPLHLLIIFGPQLPLAVAALPALWRRRSDADLLLLSWVVVGFGLLYIPTDFQIHMLNPYQVPLALLAMRVVLRFAETPGKYTLLRRWAPIGLLLLALPINVYLLSWRVLDLNRQSAPYFLHRDEVAALEWLNQQPDHEVVLSSETLGQYAPALSGKRAVLAHWAQSVDYYTKRDEVALFFAPTSAQNQRQAVIERYNVRYVLAGDAELAAGAGPALDAAGLELVFEQPHARVYMVK